MKEFEDSLLCYNCETTLQENAAFCHNCGQKRTTGKITILRIIGDFFANYFNLDAKLPRSIIPLLFRPGKLTKEYFVGKHKSYILPVQLFIFSLAIFFATLLFINRDFATGINFQQTHDNLMKRMEIDSFQQEFDTLLIQAKSNITDSSAQFILDTTFQGILKRDASLFNDSTDINIGLGINVKNGIGDDNFRFSVRDIFLLSPSEILKKYEIEGFGNRLLLKQALKSLQNERTFFHDLLNKLSWMLIFLMPFFALILQLLYWRQKRFYVEHLIFGFHYHALLFLLLTVSMIIDSYDNDAISSILQGYAVVYLFFALKQYYEQSYKKTFLKFCLLLLFYSIVITIGLVITTIVNLLLL